MRVAKSVGVRIALLSVLLVACPGVTPPRPHADPVQAATWSAEITAADIYRVVEVTKAGNSNRAGTLDNTRLALIRAAGLRLEGAVLVASSELRVYLASGSVTDALDYALTELRAARTNLELLVE